MDSARLASRLALQNNGMFTSTTAAAGGLTRHQIAGLIAREILVVPHRGVYRLAAFEDRSRLAAGRPRWPLATTL